MDEPMSGEFRWAPYVVRGALGTVIGNVLVVLLAVVYTSGTSFLRGLHYLRDSAIIVGIIPLVLSVVVGAMIGLAVGIVIYVLTQKCGKQPHAGMRATIGCLFFPNLFPNLRQEVYCFLHGLPFRICGFGWRTGWFEGAVKGPFGHVR